MLVTYVEIDPCIKYKLLELSRDVPRVVSSWWLGCGVCGWGCPCWNSSFVGRRRRLFGWSSSHNIF